MWLLIAIGLAIAVRILLPVLRARRDPLSRTLVFQFGVRPTGPDGLWTRLDRAVSGLLSLLTGGVCIGVAILAGRIEEHTRSMSTGNYVATGAMFLFSLFALLAVVSGLVDLIRAPFTKAPPAGESQSGN